MEHLEVRDSPGKGYFSTNTYGFPRENFHDFLLKLP